MSNTDLLRASEADLLPPGFVQDHVFDFTVDGYRGRAEVEMDMSPQEFARFVRAEIEDYQRVVRAVGIKPQ